jgi:ribosomal protein S18 acetylase RimI-like enzyme
MSHTDTNLPAEHGEQGRELGDEKLDSTLDDGEFIQVFLEKQDEFRDSVKDAGPGGNEADSTYDPIPSKPIPIPGKPVTPKEAAKNKWAHPAHLKTYLQTTFSTLSMPAHDECKLCGLIYNKTLEEERKKHESYCAKKSGGDMPRVEISKILLTRWVDGTGVEHSILVVDRNNSTQWKLYAENALQISYKDLGGWEIEPEQLWSEFTHARAGYVSRYKIYLHTINTKVNTRTRTKIVGVVLAESIDEGGPYYKGKKRYSEEGRIPGGAIAAALREQQEYVNVDLALPVFVSIDRIWVDEEYRRQGFARQLVDTIRDTFVRGMVVSKRQVAFSLPTSEGHAFAADYCMDTSYDLTNPDGTVIPSSEPVALFLCNPKDMPFQVDGGRLVENRGYRRYR